MSWVTILTPFIGAALLAMVIGLPPATGVNLDLPYAAEEHSVVDAERRREWRPSIPGLIVGFGAGVSITLALFKLLGGFA